MFYCIESGFFLLIIRSILLLSIFLLFVTIKIKITIEGGGILFVMQGIN